MKRLIIRILRALRIRNPSPETFLIPAYAGLGNFIMMTPMILELKRRIPGARIFLLSWPSYGTDQVFDAPVVDGGEQRERIQESEWRKSGGKGVRREDLGGRVCLARSGSFCCAPSVPDAPSLQSSILNSESSRLSAVSGVFLLDPALPMWRKAHFFLKLRQWRFAAAFIPFEACPAFVWWGFAMAGCCSVAGHTMETMGIRMGWAKSVLDISTPVNVGSHESDIHFDLLDAWDREEKRKGKTGERSYATHVASGGVEVIGKFGLCDRGYIAVQLSAANARIKTPKLWDRGKFAEVISRLAADTPLLYQRQRQLERAKREVADYAAGLKFTDPRDIAKRFIACYAPAWRDTSNRPIQNWKLKFRQVWAKRNPQPQSRSRQQKPVGNW